MSNVATVLYCPHDESARQALSMAKFRLSETGTFRELCDEAARFYAEDARKVVLKDELGAIWPMRGAVFKELGRSSHVLIRLCRRDDVDEQEEVADEGDKLSMVSTEVDDGRVVGARPPLYRELVLHTLFLLVLLFDTYSSRSSVTEHTMSKAFTDSFIESRVSDRSFHSIHTQKQACAWLRGPFTASMVLTDLDASGSVLLFNRLVGGLTLTRRYEDFVDAFEAQRLAQPDRPWANKRPATHLNVTQFLPSRVVLPPTGSVPIDTGDAEVPLANYTTVLFESQLAQLVDSVCGPDADPTRVLTEVRLEAAFCNANYDMYMSTTFIQRLTLGGKVQPEFHAVPWRMEDSTGIPAPSQMFRRLGFWLFILNYLLVLTRSISEFKAAQTVVRKHGCFRTYFASVFTLLELFNLSCNYAGLGYKIAFIIDPRRRQLEADLASPLGEVGATSLTPRELMGIGRIYSHILGLRSLSILSACFLFFKYLQLFPKKSTFYLTGTTLSRAGRDVEAVLIALLVIITAFAIVGEQCFGSTLQEFSTVGNAFITLLRVVTGSGVVYRKLTRDYQVLGMLYFVVYALISLLIVTPLFLAILNDAYAVRDEQLRQVRERARRKLDEQDRSRARLERFKRGEYDRK